MLRASVLVYGKTKGVLKFLFEYLPGFLRLLEVAPTKNDSSLWLVEGFDPEYILLNLIQGLIKLFRVRRYLSKEIKEVEAAEIVSLGDRDTSFNRWGIVNLVAPGWVESNKNYLLGGEIPNPLEVIAFGSVFVEERVGLNHLILAICLFISSTAATYSLPELVWIDLSNQAPSREN